MANEPLYPGKTIGLIGLGHNGGALIAAVKRAGYRVAVYVDHSMPETTRAADLTMVANYRAKDTLKEFAMSCDAILYPTATVDAVVLEYLAKFTSVPQGSNALEICQDRLMERAFLDQLNVNVAPYVTVISLDDVYQSIDAIGYPALLKPIQRGLGEKSMRIERQTDISRAADFIDTGTYLLESWIDHTNEYTMVAATNDQDTKLFPMTELVLDDHRKLVEVKTPAAVPDDMLGEMKRITNNVAKNLQYHGVFTVNFYVTSNGNLYVKGIQPALSVIGNVFDNTATISQEEQFLRSVTGRPLRQPVITQPGLMMVVRQAQREAVYRQWLLKDNWQFQFFLNDKHDDDPLSLAGFVWVTGLDSQDKLQNQVDDTEVWTNELPSEAGGDTLTGDPLLDLATDHDDDQAEPQDN